MQAVFRVNSMLCESIALQIWTTQRKTEKASYTASQWLCKAHFSKKSEKAIGQHSRFLSVPKRKNIMTNNYQWHSAGDRKSNMAQKTCLWRTQPQSQNCKKQQFIAKSPLRMLLGHIERKITLTCPDMAPECDGTHKVKVQLTAHEHF